MARQLWRCAVLLASLLLTSAPARAQGAGDGFLFKVPAGSFTIRGGIDRASAGSDIFAFATKNLTLNWDGCSMYYGYSRYRDSPYGYGRYGTWYSGSEPAVIVLDPPAGEHGPVSKTRGYVQGKDGSGAASTSSDSTSSSGNSSSGAASSGTSGAQGKSGGERTAHPRP